MPFAGKTLMLSHYWPHGAPSRDSDTARVSTTKGKRKPRVWQGKLQRSGWGLPTWLPMRTPPRSAVPVPHPAAARVRLTPQPPQPVASCGCAAPPAACCCGLTQRPLLLLPAARRGLRLRSSASALLACVARRALLAEGSQPLQPVARGQQRGVRQLLHAEPAGQVHIQAQRDGRLHTHARTHARMDGCKHIGQQQRASASRLGLGQQRAGVPLPGGR